MPLSVNQSVEVLSREPAIPFASSTVPVFLKQHGHRCTEVVTLCRPTRVEDIIISTIKEPHGCRTRHSIDLGRLADYRHVPRRLIRDLLCSLKPTATSDLLMLDFRDKEPNNVAHLILDIIPHYLYVERQLPNQVALLLRYVREPFTSILDRLGVKWLATRRAVRGRFVRVHGSRGLAVHELKGIFDCYGLQFFPDVYAGFAAATSGFPRRIFLGRRDQRRLLNHDAVECELGRRGYATIYMEDYSIPEQMAIGSAAERVVAVHGAAMSHLALSNRIESVVELCPPHVFPHLFTTALSRIVESYAITIQDFDERVPLAGSASVFAFKNTPFAADLELLHSALDQVGDSVRGIGPDNRTAPWPNDS